MLKLLKQINPLRRFCSNIINMIIPLNAKFNLNFKVIPYISDA